MAKGPAISSKAAAEALARAILADIQEHEGAALKGARAETLGDIECIRKGRAMFVDRVRPELLPIWDRELAAFAKSTDSFVARVRRFVSRQ